MKLRLYQEKLVQEVREHFQNGIKKVLMQSPTGSGKTVTFGDIVSSANNKGKKVLVLAHRQELILQSHRTLWKFGIKAGVIMANYDPDYRANIQVASVQSLIRRFDKYKHFDLIIVDECISGSSILITEKGNIPIKDIITSQASRVMSYNKDTKAIEWQQITAFMPKGICKTLKITTKSGKSLECTENHLLLTNQGWLRADQITPQMSILSLADADAVMYSIKTNGVDSENSSLDTKQKQEQKQIGKRFIKSLSQMPLYADADAVDRLIWSKEKLLQDSLKQREQNHTANISTNTISDLNYGKSLFLPSKDRQFLEHFWEILRYFCQIKGVNHHVYLLTTALNKLHGLSIKQNSCLPLALLFVLKTTLGMGKNGLAMLLSAYHALLRFTILLFKMDAKQLPESGLIRLEALGLHGGLEMTAHQAETVLDYIPKDILLQNVKSSRNGLTTNTVMSQSLKQTEVITTCIYPQIVDEHFYPLLTRTPQSVCNTNYDPVVSIERGNTQQVFDISVSETHCFFANGLLAHNCHHASANTYQKVFDNYPDAFILGVTATPCRVDGKGLGDLFDVLVHGEQVQSLIDMGNLVSLKYLTTPSDIDLSNVKVTGGDYNKKQLAKAVVDAQIQGDLVKHWFDHAYGLQTIVFAVDCEHSRQIVDQYCQAGIKAEHIDANTPFMERADLIKQFAAKKIQVLSNVSIFTEGFDLPEISCVQIARPTKSVSLYYQMVGRALRPCPGKTEAIILDHAGVYHEHGSVADPRIWELEESKVKLKRQRDAIRAERQKNEISVDPDTKLIVIQDSSPSWARFLNNLLLQQVEKDYKKGWVVVQFMKLYPTPEPDQLKVIAKALGYHHKWAEKFSQVSAIA